MAFTIRWTNNNPGASTVKLYRDTKPLVRAALPEPLATFTNGETEYTDRTAILGTTYYYMTTVTVGSRTLFSPQKSILIQNRRGIGIVAPQYGDDRFAYYGYVTYGELPSAGDYPPGFVALSGYDLTVKPGLMKFQLDGKILYLFSGLRANGNTLYSRDAIYNAGLLYGVAGPGPEGGHGDLPDVDQAGEFTWLGDRYRMRLLRGLTLDSESPVMTLDAQWDGKTHDASPYTADSEYNRLIYGISSWFPAKKKVMSLLMWSNYSIFGSGSAVSGRGVHCQEFDPDRKLGLTRGTAMTDSTDTVDNLQRIQHVPGATVGGIWIPVIELIED